MLGHHFHQITVAELVGDVPPNAKNDDEPIKMTTVEESGRVRAARIHAEDYHLTSAFAPEPTRASSLFSAFRSSVPAAEAHLL